MSDYNVQSKLSSFSFSCFYFFYCFFYSCLRDVGYGGCRSVKGQTSSPSSTSSSSNSSLSIIFLGMECSSSQLSQKGRWDCSSWMMSACIPLISFLMFIIYATSSTMSTFLDFFLKSPSLSRSFCCDCFLTTALFLLNIFLQFQTFMCPLGVSVGQENSLFLISCFFDFFYSGFDGSFMQLSTLLTGMSWFLETSCCALLGETTLSVAGFSKVQSMNSPREGALSKILMAWSVVCENYLSLVQRGINSPILGQMSGCLRTSLMDGLLAGST